VLEAVQSGKGAGRWAVMRARVVCSTDQCKGLPCDVAPPHQASERPPAPEYRSRSRRGGGTATGHLHTAPRDATGRPIQGGQRATGRKEGRAQHPRGAVPASVCFKAPGEKPQKQWHSLTTVRGAVPGQCRGSAEAVQGEWVLRGCFWKSHSMMPGSLEGCSVCVAAHRTSPQESQQALSRPT